MASPGFWMTRVAPLVLSLLWVVLTAPTVADDIADDGAAPVATTHETPPILNFGSLDGYYRVLGGEIGIAGVRCVRASS